MNAWWITYLNHAGCFKLCFLFATSEKKLITDALNKNQFLKRLEPHQTRDMVECMYERTFQQGSYVIRQGEPGNHIFVLKGEYSFLVHNCKKQERGLDSFSGNHSEGVCASK